MIAFQHQPPSATALNDFEEDLLRLTRLLGRDALEHVLTSIEPDEKHERPDDIKVAGIRYRCRGKTPHMIASTFGRILLRRFIFEPRQPGNPCLFPLEHLLGL